MLIYVSQRECAPYYAQSINKVLHNVCDGSDGSDDVMKKEKTHKFNSENRQTGNVKRTEERREEKNCTGHKRQDVTATDDQNEQVFGIC